MTIEVRAPDGSTVSFPDDASPDLIHSEMSRHFGGPQVSTGRALGEGYMDTAGFGLRDEVRGLSVASGLPEWLGGFRAPVGAARLAFEKMTGKTAEVPAWMGETTNAPQVYESARDEARRVQKAAQEQHPGAYLGGQLAGGVVGSLAMPGGALEEGAGVLARAGSAAKSGALYGGLYGFGSGEGAADSAVQAGVGAVTGGVAGGVVSPVTDIARWAGGKALDAGSKVYQLVRSSLNPEFVSDEAARRIGQAIDADTAARGFPWDRETQAAAARTGIDRGVADLGGERTMALARSAANESPEGRAALTEFANERFAGQSQRAARFVKDLTGGADAAGDLEAIRERARMINRPRYAAAYAAGDRPIWSPELERLTASPSIQQAMKSAITTGKDRSVAEGFGEFNPGVTVSPDGRIAFGRNPRTGGIAYPNLHYFDMVQRDLKDMGEKVAGREPDKAMFLNRLHQDLNTELDRLVPQFQNARVGAWRAFQSEDALEAGRKFVSARGENGAYARDIAKMSDPDRELFARGYASELAGRVLELRDNQDLIKQAFVTSPAAKERHAMALGPDRANQLEAYLRAESLSNRLREALGNSTTARQLHELGLAGAGTGLLAGEGLGFLHNGEGGGEGHALGAALAIGGAFAAHKSQAVQASIARRIGEMLTSQDPAVLNRGVQLVARSENLMNALRAAGDRLAPALSRITAQQALPGEADVAHGFYRQ